MVAIALGMGIEVGFPAVAPIGKDASPLGSISLDGTLSWRHNRKKIMPARFSTAYGVPAELLQRFSLLTERHYTVVIRLGPKLGQIHRKGY